MNIEQFSNKRYAELLKKGNELDLTKSERRAYDELIDEHLLKNNFTAYFKDDFDQNQPLCSAASIRTD